MLVHTLEYKADCPEYCPEEEHIVSIQDSSPRAGEEGEQHRVPTTEVSSDLDPQVWLYITQTMYWKIITWPQLTYVDTIER